MYPSLKNSLLARKAANDATINIEAVLEQPTVEDFDVTIEALRQKQDKLEMQAATAENVSNLFLPALLLRVTKAAEARQWEADVQAASQAHVAAITLDMITERENQPVKALRARLGITERELNRRCRELDITPWWYVSPEKAKTTFNGPKEGDYLQAATITEEMLKECFTLTAAETCIKLHTTRSALEGRCRSLHIALWWLPPPRRAAEITSEQLTNCDGGRLVATAAVTLASPVAPVLNASGPAEDSTEALGPARQIHGYDLLKSATTWQSEARVDLPAGLLNPISKNICFVNATMQVISHKPRTHDPQTLNPKP
jgi:hypothetical protein